MSAEIFVDLITRGGFAVAVAAFLLWYVVVQLRGDMKEQKEELKHLTSQQETTNIILAKIAQNQGIENPERDRRHDDRRTTPD